MVAIKKIVLDESILDIDSWLPVDKFIESLNAITVGEAVEYYYKQLAIVDKDTAFKMVMEKFSMTKDELIRFCEVTGS